jgi:hypothetical protein
MNYFFKLLLIAALITPLFTFAQSNYKPGFVVTTKGDTLQGFINIKEWNVNPKKINFKISPDKKESRELGTNDITFFKATNLETYQRYIGLLNIDPTNISSLSNGRNTDTKTDSVFLKVIQKGANITLFEYADNLKNHYFVAEGKDGLPVELVYRVYKNDGKTVNENGYMQQLFTLSEKYNGNDALKTRIERTDYNFTDLVETARLINHNDKKDDESTTGKKQGTFFFASAGLNISTINSNYAFDDFKSTGGKSTPTSFFPRIAIGANVLANPNTGKLVFRVQLAYTANKYKGTQVYSGGTQTYSLTQNNISIIPQILYNFYNTDSFKFYGAAGTSFNISNYSGNKAVFNNTGVGIVEHSNYIQQLSPRWFSFPLNVGAVINKKIDITAAYIPNAIFTKNNTDYVQVSAVQIGINYIFN